jgi:hypothetical protein
LDFQVVCRVLFDRGLKRLRLLLLAPTNIRRKPSANPFPKDAQQTHKAIWRPRVTTLAEAVDT